MQVSFCPKCGEVRADNDENVGVVFCPECHSAMEVKGSYDWRKMSLGEQNELKNEWLDAAGMGNSATTCPVCGKANTNHTYNCLCGYDYKTNRISKGNLRKVAAIKSSWLVVICTIILCYVLKAIVGKFDVISIIVFFAISSAIIIPIWQKKMIKSSGCITGENSDESTRATKT